MLVPVVLGFALSVISACLWAGPISRLLGVVDHPDGRRKKHLRPTPLVGGLALVTPLSAVALAFAIHAPETTGALFMAFSLAGFGAMLLGMFDDRGGLPPVLRLVVAVGGAVLLLLLEPALIVRVIDLGPPGLALPLGPFAIPFTLLCIVGLMNALNMVDGKNGLLIGLSIAATLCLLLYAPAHFVPYLGLLLLGLVILWPFNWTGRLFMGDAGSYALGAVLGLSAIHVYNADGGAGLPQFTVVLWLLVPVVDCLRLMTERALAGRSPMDADADHFHHRLARLWPWPQALAVYLAVAAAPGLLAAFEPELTWFLIALALALYAGLLRLGRRRGKAGGSLPATAGSGARD